MGLALLIPLSIAMGLVGLASFIWALRQGQFDDPEGAAWRVLTPQDPPEPEPDPEA
ncbi:MAG TPA: cbb3-type cytochrome oxidase assembly protein CcoS [Paracoccaceae bacterium]|nr:cbb3-type cytochrome oxidase assembly protein CcoS [Paracoccaceae bacterium]